MANVFQILPDRVWFWMIEIMKCLTSSFGCWNFTVATGTSLSTPLPIHGGTWCKLTSDTEVLTDWLLWLADECGGWGGLATGLVLLLLAHPPCTLPLPRPRLFVDISNACLIGYWTWDSVSELETREQQHWLETSPSDCKLEDICSPW